MQKTMARKTLKNDNQTYLWTSQQPAVTAQQEENFLQPAIKRYKKEKNNMLEKQSMFSFFCAAYHHHGGSFCATIWKLSSFSLVGILN